MAPIETLLCVDVETQGLDPAVHHVVEVGAVLWSVRWSCVVACWSDLVQQPTNEAQAINRIPASALPLGIPQDRAITILRGLAARADLVVAHRAEFDSSFLPDLGKPWVCSKFDIEWPLSQPGDSLVHLALAHGVGVTRAHRALTDCLLLAHTFEAVAAEGVDLQQLLARAMRPKATFQALVSYEDRELAKAARFQWEASTKRWLRRMAIEDAGKLGFKVRQLTGDSKGE